MRKLKMKITKNISLKTAQAAESNRAKILFCEVQARNAAAALAYPITDLWICSLLQESGKGLEWDQLYLRLLPFPENPANLRKDVYTPVAEARDRGLIRRRHYTNSPYILTDAGLYLVMTYKRGSKAHSILADIEQAE